MSEHSETPYRCSYTTGRQRCYSFRICCGTSEDKYATAKCREHCAEHGLPTEILDEPAVGPRTARARRSLSPRREVRMKLLYIAGPIRAENYYEIEKNIRRAEEVALAISALGAAVICPHSMARFYEHALPVELWLERDIEILKRCDGMVVVCPFRHSKGTVGEVQFCEENNIPVFYVQAHRETFEPLSENFTPIKRFLAE